MEGVTDAMEIEKRERSIAVFQDGESREQKQMASHTHIVGLMDLDLYNNVACTWVN